MGDPHPHLRVDMQTRAAPAGFQVGDGFPACASTAEGAGAMAVARELVAAGA